MQAFHSIFIVWKSLQIYFVDNDFGPGLLLSHGSDLLVEFLNLRLDCSDVWCQLLLAEFINRGEGEISPTVPLDSGNGKFAGSFLVSEDIVDCVSHLE